MFIGVWFTSKIIEHLLEGFVIKILLVNKYHYIKGGAERYEFELGRLLSMRGHEVGFFSMQDKNNIPSEFEQFFVTNRNYHTNDIKKKILEASRFIYSREARIKLGKLVDIFQPDIAHLHNIYHQLTPSIIWELHKRKIPTILTLHDYKLVCPIYEFMDKSGHVCTRCAKGSVLPILAGRCGRGGRSAMAILFAEAVFHRLIGSYRRMVSAFIVPSLFLLDIIKQAAVVPQKTLHHIPNFINYQDYEATYHDNGYFLYAGRLSRSKDVITLLEAVTGLPGCRLKIAGTGDEEDTLKNLSKQNKDQIEMLGYCDQNRLRSLMSGARAVVISSKGFENCPMVVLEAFACGKPVIASAIGGLPEMVVPGETGLLFKPGDVNELRTRLQEGMTNVDEFRRMGLIARKRVETFYAPETHYDALMNLYNQVLSIGMWGQK